MYKVRVKKEFKKSVKTIIKNVKKLNNLPLKNKKQKVGIDWTSFSGFYENFSRILLSKVTRLKKRTLRLNET